MKKIIFSGLKVLFTCLGLFFLYKVFQSSSAEIMAVLERAPIFIIVILFAGVLFFKVALPFRLSIMLRALDAPVRFLDVWRITFIGYFFNLFLPSSIGGDTARCFYFAKLSGKRDASLLAVITDRLIGLSALLIISFCALFVVRSKLDVDYLLPLLSGLSLLGILFLYFIMSGLSLRLVSSFKKVKFLSRIVNYVKELHDIVFRLRKKKRYVAAALMISIVYQLMAYTAVYVFARVLGIDLDFVIVAALVPLVMISSLFPSINGMGVREGIFVYLFQFFIPRGEALVLGLIVGCFDYFSGLTGIVVYLLSNNEKMCSHSGDNSLNDNFANLQSVPE